MLRQDKGVRVRIRVRDGVRVRRRVKLVNYSSITALPIVTSAHPLIRFLPVVFLPTRPQGFSVRYDLYELFNIDAHRLSIDIWFIYGLPPE